ncbi:hemerythrin domain-containing protein [Bacillus tuaregi]|uniref:hemerythrin domain-containing protein n=1 Tax=Bacillus tuaregi TaxID=1816695 RepID=UPI0013565CCE|nr:hemerythrin domain-containing protein [Bacillus tuaregi]
MEGCMSSMMGNDPVKYSEGFVKLLADHDALREQLDELLQMVHHLENQVEKAKVFTALTENVVVFFKALEAHSEKEETILFPMLETFIGKNGGPIAVMEYEHEQAKGLIQAFLAKAALLLSDVEMVSHATLVKEAHSLLNSHFMKEENVLFPMGERLFSDTEKEELFEKLSM